MVSHVPIQTGASTNLVNLVLERASLPEWLDDDDHVVFGDVAHALNRMEVGVA